MYSKFFNYKQSQKSESIEFMGNLVTSTWLHIECLWADFTEEIIWVPSG